MMSVWGGGGGGHEHYGMCYGFNSSPLGHCGGLLFSMSVPVTAEPSQHCMIALDCSEALRR